MANDSSSKRAVAKTNRSAARAKPKRGAASSIRTTTAASSKSSKRQAAEAQMQSAKKSSGQSAEDRIALAANYMLQEDATYKRKRRSWWILMGITFVLLIISLVSNQMYQASDGANELSGTVSRLCSIASLVYMAAAFLWDWRSVRPLRTEAEDRVRGMTAKKQEEFIIAHEQRDAKSGGSFLDRIFGGRKG